MAKSAFAPMEVELNRKFSKALCRRVGGLLPIRFQSIPKAQDRTAINASTYEALHAEYQLESVVKPSGEFILKSVGGSGVLEGHRKYTWVDSKKINFYK